MRRLKLYVWEDVLEDWTPGIMFALAKDANAARELISPGYLKRKAESVHRTWMDTDLDKDPVEVTAPAGFSCSGGS